MVVHLPQSIWEANHLEGKAILAPERKNGPTDTPDGGTKTTTEGAGDLRRG